MEDSNAELESFRQKWREEVLAKTKSNTEPPRNPAELSGSSRRPPAPPRIASEKAHEAQEDNESYEARDFVDIEKPSGAILPTKGESSNPSSREPRSALEHYEKAVERESLGSLGDSLDLYRKAFRVSIDITLLVDQSLTSSIVRF